MTTMKVLPTKKGNGLHLTIYHNSPPGSHQLSLDFATAILLASQLYREGLKGLIAKDLESMEKWQIEHIRNAIEILTVINGSPGFKQFSTQLLGPEKRPVSVLMEE